MFLQFRLITFVYYLLYHPTSLSLIKSVRLAVLMMVHLHVLSGSR